MTIQIEVNSITNIAKEDDEIKYKYYQYNVHSNPRNPLLYINFPKNMLKIDLSVIL